MPKEPMGICENCKEWVSPVVVNDELVCPHCLEEYIDLYETKEEYGQNTDL